MNRVDCKKVLLDFFEEYITNDYIFLDLPYYTNVGDVLIWQSTLDLLKKHTHKCLYSASIESYIKPNISKEVIILFMGGGNFGDVWKRHQDFRRKVMSDFPENPVIQLPQSVCFRDESFLREDVDFFSKHKGNVTICLRDKKSYDIIYNNYKTVSAKLLPDMVLSFDVEKYAKLYDGNGSLYVKRKDSEKTEYNETIVPKDAIVADWPTMEQRTFGLKMYDKIQRFNSSFDRRLRTHLYNSTADFCFKRIFKNKIIKSGIKFVNQYKTVYSTRLHVAILAALLEKQTFVFDNSYGKIKGVYDLWMQDWKTIKML